MHQIKCNIHSVHELLSKRKSPPGDNLQRWRNVYGTFWPQNALCSLKLQHPKGDRDPMGGGKREGTVARDS